MSDSDKSTSMVLYKSVQKLVSNSIAMARSAIASRAGKMYDGARNTWKILGYKTLLEYDDFLAMYNRGDVAGRIVDMHPQETWRDAPLLVSRVDGVPQDDPFFKGMREFADRVKLWHWLEQVDRVSGIGRFGVLFIGVSDSGKLDTEIVEAKLEDVIYLRAYPQGAVKIVEFDEDPSSPRFGLPAMYQITLGDFQTETAGRAGSAVTRGKGGTGKKEELVHWSRVVHIAEDAVFDNVHGRPRLERVFNRLYDLAKVVGGSSEMFWQNVAQIFHVNLDPELQYDDDDLKQLDEKFQEMLQGIRRIVQTEGIEKIDTLQGGTPDPRGVFEVLRAIIASTAEIPQRMLFGSEQGQLASEQDQSEWYGRIKRRRSTYADPLIIRAFIERLASWGAVTVPKEGYDVAWPNLFEESPLDKSNRARHLAIAAKNFDADVPDRLFTVEEIRLAGGFPAKHPDPNIVEKRQKMVDEKADKELEAKKKEPPIPAAGGAKNA